MNSLILFRHSKAEKNNGRDEDRRLTEKGILRMRAIAARAAELQPARALILSSPLVRARQSAEIIAESYGIPVEDILEYEQIAYAVPSEVTAIFQQYNGRDLICVGHMPTLSYLAAELSSERHLPMDFNFFPGQFLLLNFKGKYLKNRGIMRCFYSVDCPEMDS